MHRGDPSLRLLWGSARISTLRWAFLAVRFGLALLVTTLAVLWDFVTTTATVVWRLLVDIWPRLVLVALGFVVLYVISIRWPQFVDFLNNVLLRVLDVLYNKVVRLAWNDVGHPILNIVIYLWNSLVQLIGFVIYFALNLFLTLSMLLIDILGALDLGAFIEDLMEVVMPIVELAIEVLKLLIQVGAALVEKLIPIVVAVLKIWFQYIKVMFKIISWLLVTLVRVLMPYLKFLIAVVTFVMRVFGVGSAAYSARFLLAFEELSSVASAAREAAGASFSTPARGPRVPADLAGSRGTDDAANYMAAALYEAAMEQYSLGQYGTMFGLLEDIHEGMRECDAYGYAGGSMLEPGQGVPDYTAYLYDDDELEPHERKPWLMRERPERSGGSSVVGGGANRRQRTARQGGRTSLRAPAPAPPAQRAALDAVHPPAQRAALDAVQRTQRELIDAVVAPLLAEQGDGGGAKEAIERWDAITVEDVDEIEEAEAARADAERQAATNDDDDDDPVGSRAAEACHTVDGDAAAGGEQDTCSASPLDDPEPYSSLHPDEHWRIDGARRMPRDAVFPALRGRKLVKVRLSQMMSRPKTPEHVHEVRRRAVAHAHAIKHAIRAVYKKHIRTGHMHQVFSSTFQRLTGHASVHDWVAGLRGRYGSVAHMFYENVPALHDWGLFRHAKLADPEHATRPFFHDWVRAHVNACGIIEREHWERWAAETEAAEDEAAAHADYEPRGASEAAAAASAARGRRLAGSSPLGINLDVLYKDDCFTTRRRNILCLPQIPDSWKLPYIDFRALVLSRDLDNETACAPVWRATHCIYCWDGFVNTLQSLRFLIYVADLPWAIAFDIFSQRPSEYLGYVPLLNLLLLYERGTFPDAHAWSCFLSRLYYLYFAFVFFILMGYLKPLLFDFPVRAWSMSRAFGISCRARLAVIRADMELFSETLLATVHDDFARAQARRAKINSPGYNPIGAELMQDDGAATAAAADWGRSAGRDGSVRIDVGELGAGAAGRASRADRAAVRPAERLRIAEENREQLVEITRLRVQLDDKRRTVSARMDALARDLGLAARPPHAHVEAASRRRRATRAWHFVTSVLQMPYHLTPSYLDQLANYEARASRSRAPPGAGAFAAAVPGGTRGRDGAHESADVFFPPTAPMR